MIKWPYENCVQSLASGRSVGWEDSMVPVLGSRFFQPPPRIAQTTALASCCTLFRHTARYMAVIDDDEFLLTEWRTVKELVVSAMEEKFPRAPAISFPSAPCWSATVLHEQTRPVGSFRACYLAWVGCWACSTKASW